MGAVISRYVFMAPRVSYDHTLDSLVYIDGRIPSIILMQPIARSEAITVLFSHGNAEDLGRVLPWVDVLYDQCKFNVCAWEYLGYGVHTNTDGTVGSPSEESINEDIYAVYKYLVNIKRVPPQNIILYGRSLGTGPTCALAARLCELEVLRGAPHIGGIILQSAFLSCLKVAGSFWTNVLSDMFDNEHLVHLITCPAMVVHGTEDTIVPIHHGEGLAARLPHLFRFLVIQGGTHNDLEERHRTDMEQGLMAMAAYVFRVGRRRHQILFGELSNEIPYIV
eukprot:PhF_6_TR35737/c0_g1_i1/m.51896